MTSVYLHSFFLLGLNITIGRCFQWLNLRLIILWIRPSATFMSMSELCGIGLVDREVSEIVAGSAG